MTPQELQNLKESLLKERSLIESELKVFTHKDPLLKNVYQTDYIKPDQSDTPDEKARSLTTYEEESAVAQNFESRLREIDKTIKKLEEGRYGICDNCLSPIEQRRLTAMPAARLCVACVKKQQH